MTPTQRKAMEMALHALGPWRPYAHTEVIEALRTALAEYEPIKLEDIEQYRLQMAGISTAAIGYWKEGDSIHPDHDTPALRDVAKLYAKYHELYCAEKGQPAEQEQEPVAWCDVAGFESYEVSSNGDLRNKKTGQIMAKNLAGAGYVKADFWANGQRKQTTVHRLVAEAFLGPAEGREVNHKNGNKQDNRVSNLEWCSRSDNVNHGYYKLGIRVKPIRVTNIATGEVRCYPSANEAVRDGFHSARIHECLSGKRTSHGGFSFEYDTAPQPAQVVNLTDEQASVIADKMVQAIEAHYRTRGGAI